MKRRKFLKLSACTPLLALGDAHSRENYIPSKNVPSKNVPSKNAVGLLYDSTLCINCQSCVSACKYVNNMAPDLATSASSKQDVWVINDDLSSKTLSVIQQHQSGSAELQNQESNGTSLLKKQCMHCVEPSCVSACPVNAMRKDPNTGIVSYDADACIGCRYCIAACPFGVPQFEFYQPFGKIQKCQLCNQPEVARIDNGLLPACAEVCPVGATVYGTREELLAQAKERLSKPPGTLHDYPLGKIGADEVNTQPLPVYQPHIYGENEGGGTQVLYLAAVPFETLSLPALPDKSAASRSEDLQQTMTGALPLAALAGLVYLSHRRRDLAHTEDLTEQENRDENIPVKN